MTIKDEINTNTNASSQNGANVYDNNKNTQGGLADNLDFGFDPNKAQTSVVNAEPSSSSTKNNYANGLDLNAFDDNQSNQQGVYGDPSQTGQNLRADKDGSNEQREYGEPPKTGQQLSADKDNVDIERAYGEDTNKTTESSSPLEDYELNEEDERRIRRNRRVRGVGGVFCLIFVFFFFGRAWWWGGGFMRDDDSQNEDDLWARDNSFAPSMVPSLAPEPEASPVPTTNSN